MGLWNTIKSAVVSVTSFVKGLVTPERAPRGADPRLYLMGRAPGLWASNHLQEAQQVTGWQFVAIRAVSRMCSNAELSIHEVGSLKAQRRRIRRAMRWASVSGDGGQVRYWKQRLKELKSETVASSVPRAKKPVGEDHPLRKFLQRPNPEWSLKTLLYAIAQQIEATGSCMLWLVRDAMTGLPAEMYVLPTGLLTPQMPTAEHPRGSYHLAPLSQFGMGGNQWMPGTLGNALMFGSTLDARDVKPIRWPHPICLSDGLSPLAAGALWVDTANEMDRACFYGMQNTEKPGLMFKWTGAGRPDEADMNRFREDLAADHTGTPNTGKHLIVPEGLEPLPRANLPADMDYANGAPRYRDNSLALHGVGPISCGITEAGSYASNYAAETQATEKTIQPLLDLIAGELTELLGEAFDGPACEISLGAKAVNDPQMLESRLKTDILAGNVLTVKEYRTMRGLPPLGDERDEDFAGAGSIPEEDEEKNSEDSSDGNPTETSTGASRNDRRKPAGRPGKKKRGPVVSGQWSEKEGGHYDPNEPRDERGRWTEGAGTPGKKKANRGEMVSARRTGTGKEAKVVLADGKDAPEHITAAMVGADWSDVKIALDPDADVLATGRDSKGRAKTTYSGAFHMKQAAAKFARTREGLEKSQELLSQVLQDRADSSKKNNAECAWLMMEQATRPGSESDNKGTSKYFGVEISKKEVVIKDDKVSLKVKDTLIPIKDKKARAELIRRVENNLPLHDSTYWLKSHGATTLEGRHVVQKADGVYLEFMGKESVWHSHRIRNPELARTLVARKHTAGERGSLFGTDYDRVSAYAKKLDGGKFTPKDFRTQRATALAVEEISKMPVPTTEKDKKAAIKAVAQKVSSVLGNEPAQALASYIAPEVFSVWELKE